jgi:hypothetical protein
MIIICHKRSTTYYNTTVQYSTTVDSTQLSRLNSVDSTHLTTQTPLDNEFPSFLACQVTETSSHGAVLDEAAARALAWIGCVCCHGRGLLSLLLSSSRNTNTSSANGIHFFHFHLHPKRTQQTSSIQVPQSDKQRQHNRYFCDNSIHNTVPG